MKQRKVTEDISVVRRKFPSSFDRRIRPGGDFKNIYAEKLAFFAQNKAKLCKNLIITNVLFFF
jgi:hypothetical protein